MEGIRQRAVWVLVAQVLSSGGNFLLTLGALSFASRRDFAVFSLCFTTFLLLSQLGRSFAGLPVLILYSSEADREEHGDYRSAVGAAVGLGLLASCILSAIAIFFYDGRWEFAVLAAAIPLLLFQDAVRQLAFARGKPATAAAGDALWLALQLLGFAVIIYLGVPSARVLLAAWATAGCIAGLALGVRLGVYPHLSGALKWARSNRSLWQRLVSEFLVNSGSYYLLLYALPLLAGLTELGRLKAGQTLIGPVIVLLLGGNALGVPESVRVKSDPLRLRSFAFGLSSLLAGASLSFGLVVFFALPIFGPIVFANSWATARPLMPTLTIYAAAVGASTGVSSALRALGANSWILRARALSSGLALLVGLPLSGIWGAQGTLVGLAISEWAFAALAWRELRRSHRLPKPTTEPEIFLSPELS